MPATRQKTKFVMENADLAALMRTIVREEIATGLETNLKPIKDELSKIQLKETSCLDKVDSLEAAANEAETRLSRCSARIKRCYGSLLIETESPITPKPKLKVQPENTRTPGGNRTRQTHFVCERHAA